MRPFFLPDTTEFSSKIKVILYYCILGYIVSLFLKDAPVVTNVLMVAIFILAWFSISPSDYIRYFSKNSINIGLILFFLLQVISVLFVSNDKTRGVSMLVLRLPLFVLPLALSLIDFDKHTWNKILLFYAVVTTLASLVGFGAGVYNAVAENDSGFLYNDNIATVVSKQAAYFSFYIGIAILIFIFLLQHNNVLIRNYRGLIFLCLSWLFFIIFMLASKTAMVSIAVISLYLITVNLVRKRKLLEVALILFTFIIGSIIVGKLFPKTLNRFYGVTQIDFQYDNQKNENHFNENYDQTKWNSTNTRVAIWKCAIEVWENHPLFGTGVGDVKEDLKTKYEEKKFWYALITEKNVHNQYLHVLVSMGIVGLIVFLVVFFIYPIRKFVKEKQFFAISVYLLMALCFLTENMFSRYQGVIIIGFILPLVGKNGLLAKKI